MSVIGGKDLSKIEKNVEDLIKPIITNLGYKLYDVIYEKEAKDYYLRIFIDKDPTTPAGVGYYRLFQHQGTLFLQGQRDTPDAGRTPDKEQQREHRQPDNQPPTVC